MYYDLKLGQCKEVKEPHLAQVTQAADLRPRGSIVAHCTVYCINSIAVYDQQMETKCNTYKPGTRRCCCPASSQTIIVVIIIMVSEQ